MVRGDDLPHFRGVLDPAHVEGSKYEADSLAFQDVLVPVENLIGEENAGFKMIMTNVSDVGTFYLRLCIILMRPLLQFNHERCARSSRRRPRSKAFADADFASPSPSPGVAQAYDHLRCSTPCPRLY